MITEQSGSIAGQAEKSHANAGWILFAVCILGVMIQIDFTAVNVALIEIAKTVNADLSTVQWALSAYVLAWGSFVLTAGRCADLFGKRRTFLIGTMLFMIGSALTGAANAAWFLIFGRVVQGIGGALFLPGLYTLVFTAYPEHKRGSALGILTAAIAVGLAVGPTFGGLVLHWLNWRWIFFLNLPLGIPVIAIILWAVPREPWRLIEEPMDYIGAFLIIISLLLLMIALNQANAWGAGSTQFLSMLFLSLLLIGIFIFYERRKTHPLIQLEMFKNITFLGCSLTYIFMGFSFAAILIMIGLYLQNGLGYSAFDTGFIFLVMTVMFGILSVYSGKWVDRMDARIPIVSGVIAITFALLVFALCTQHSPLWLPVLGLALFGVGTGLGFPALNVAMMKSTEPRLLNTASSTFAMFCCIGNTLGLIFSSVMIVIFGQRKLTQLLAAPTWHLTATQQTELHTMIGSAHYTADTPALLEVLRAAFVHAMSVSMMVAGIFSIAVILISLTMIKLAPAKNSNI